MALTSRNNLVGGKIRDVHDRKTSNTGRKKCLRDSETERNEGFGIGLGMAVIEISAGILHRCARTHYRQGQGAV